ncbi:MAG: hypothetical protein E4G89_07425 [Methanothrix sp.]|nr:MAG: hypothetical protein E4G89_07425 [Methanothrix sp.]
MKERINISIDKEVAKAMRVEAIKKYGSLRAFSQLIEDTYTHKNQVSEDPGLTPEEIAVLPADDLESAVNPLTERLYINRTEFKRSVDTTYRLINGLEITDATDGCSISADDVTRFFVLKAAYERAQNKIANSINRCYKCCFLKGPLPTYPEQDTFAIMDKLHNRVMPVASPPLERPRASMD